MQKVAQQNKSDETFCSVNVACIKNDDNNIQQANITPTNCNDAIETKHQHDRNQATQKNTSP